MGFGGSVKEKAGFRAGRVQYKLLSWLASTGLRRFNLTEATRSIGEDVRRVHQAIACLVKRIILAREARGSVKENHGTRSGVVRASGMSAVGLFFDNVRGYALAGGYVHGDRPSKIYCSGEIPPELLAVCR
jgi:hypothetical protein